MLTHIRLEMDRRWLYQHKIKQKEPRSVPFSVFYQLDIWGMKVAVSEIHSHGILNKLSNSL